MHSQFGVTTDYIKFQSSFITPQDTQPHRAVTLRAPATTVTGRLLSADVPSLDRRPCDLCRLTPAQQCPESVHTVTYVGVIALWLNNVPGVHSPGFVTAPARVTLLCRGTRVLGCLVPTFRAYTAVWICWVVR